MDNILFYWTPEEDEKDRDIIAFMPDITVRPGYIACYQHVGMHGCASRGYMEECTPATPEEYRDLKAELISIGYILE